MSGERVRITISSASEQGNARLLESAMARYHYAGDALIEVLHAAQGIYGYLTEALLGEIAQKLHLPASRVLGVASFYHLFRFAAPAEHEMIVCVGTACYVQGGAEVLEAARRQCSQHSGWSVEAGRCVGSCGLAPVVICDGAALSRVTTSQFRARIGSINDGRDATPDQ